MKQGDRVEIHPAFDEWMQGDRYGEVIGLDERSPRPYRVKLDKSKSVRKYTEDDLTLID